MKPSLNSNIYTEKVSVKAWSKLFGKAINSFGPSAMIRRLESKAENAGASVNLIASQKAKLSQYNHHSDTYVKKKLSERWAFIGGQKVQRDLYSSFLAMCISEERQLVERATAVKLWSRLRHVLHEAAQQAKTQHANRSHTLGSSAGF